MQVIQAEAETVTVQGNKRHIDGENNYDTGSDKYPPSVNDGAIDAEKISLDLDLQQGGGPQRPNKTPCRDTAFLDNYVPLFHTEPER